MVRNECNIGLQTRSKALNPITTHNKPNFLMNLHLGYTIQSY